MQPREEFLLKYSYNCKKSDRQNSLFFGKFRVRLKILMQTGFLLNELQGKIKS
jgi:hypothetical protein